MGFESERATIETMFLQEWIKTPIESDNVDFDQPEPDDEDAAWVRLVIHRGVGQRASLGGNALYRYPGVVVIQIFTPLDGSTQKGSILADEVTKLFRDRKEGEITFRVPSVRRIGKQDGWYQINVEIPYKRDEIT